MRHLMIFFSLCFLGCEAKYTADEYISFIDHSSAHTTIKEIGKYTLTTKYKPAQYLALKEIMKADGTINKSEYQSLVSQFSNNLNFDITLSAKDTIDKVDNGNEQIQNINIVKLYTFNKDNLATAPISINKVKYQHQVNQWSVLFSNHLKSFDSNAFKMYISFTANDGIIKESMVSFDKTLLEQQSIIVLKTLP